MSRRNFDSPIYATWQRWMSRWSHGAPYDAYTNRKQLMIAKQTKGVGLPRRHKQTSVVPLLEIKERLYEQRQQNAMHRSIRRSPTNNKSVESAKIKQCWKLDSTLGSEGEWMATLSKSNFNASQWMAINRKLASLLLPIFPLAYGNFCGWSLAIVYFLSFCKRSAKILVKR